MKKRISAVILCFSLFVGILSPFMKKAYADSFTATQIAGTAYAMMQSWGIGFTAGSSTDPVVMSEFMTGNVEEYANYRGSTVADTFVGSIAVDVAGKLVVGHTMYNAVIDFVDWLKEKYTLSSSDFSLVDGTYHNTIIPSESGGVATPSGVGYELIPSGPLSPSSDPRNPPAGGYQSIAFYDNGTLLFSQQCLWGTNAFTGSFNIAKEGQLIVAYIHRQAWDGGFYADLARNIATVYDPLPNSLSWNGTDFVEPTVLNPDKEWTGDIGGYSVPDTNFDQLVGDIFDAVADNNLDVDGEIIDIPVPPQPVPTWAPVDDVIDGLNGLGDELTDIGNDIGDISGHLDDIGDQIGDISGALDGVQQGIESQTGVISGAIDQAASDVVDAINEQTSTLDETLSGTAESVQDIADALQDETINWPKFNLRGLFPFCIPFDIYNMLEALDASPIAPHVQLPFVIESIDFSYTIDLDFSAFDTVAAVMRQMELIVYGIALAWATSKVIKW